MRCDEGIEGDDRASLFLEVGPYLPIGPRAVPRKIGDLERQQESVECRLILLHCCWLLDTP